MGDTKLYNLDVFDFLKQIETESVDLITTDAPYSSMNSHLKLGKGRIVGEYKNKEISGDWFQEFKDTEENYKIFLNECNRILKPKRHIFMMFDSFSLLSLGNLVKQYFSVKNIIIWNKQSIGMGHYFRRVFETILFASKLKRPIVRRDIVDIWSIKRIHNAKYPTQKPTELFEAMISSSRGKDTFVVCDPFMGSGSSGIAALKQNCSYIGNDVSKIAYNLASERICEFKLTGKDILQPKPTDCNMKKFWND